MECESSSAAVSCKEEGGDDSVCGVNSDSFQILTTSNVQQHCGCLQRLIVRVES